MKTAIKLISVCFIVLLLAVPAIQAGDLTLTGDHIARFLKDFPAFAEMISKHKGFEGSKASDYLTAQGISKEVMGFLEKRGWNPETFSLVSNRILQAYAAIQYETAKKEGGADMEEAQKQMQAAMKDPSLSPEMKAMMQQSMAMAQQQMQSNPFKDVSPADIQTVRPSVPQIASMLENLSLEE